MKSFTYYNKSDFEFLDLLWHILYLSVNNCWSLQNNPVETPANILNCIPYAPSKFHKNLCGCGRFITHERVCILPEIP